MSEENEGLTVGQLIVRLKQLPSTYKQEFVTVVANDGTMYDIIDVQTNETATGKHVYLKIY